PRQGRIGRDSSGRGPRVAPPGGPEAHPAAEGQRRQPPPLPARGGDHGAVAAPRDRPRLRTGAGRAGPALLRHALRRRAVAQGRHRALPRRRPGQREPGRAHPGVAPAPRAGPAPVAHAHSRGLMHLDLKPGNIMLGGYDETLVVDWGLARPFRQRGPERTGDEATLEPVADQGEASMQMGQAAGTPAYMSPEQKAGRWDVIGPASDVHSLGATFYVLLTGRT